MDISVAQKIKTGAFVLLSLLLLLALIFFVGKQKNMLGGTFGVYAHFKNIAGLKEGNYVRYAGINVGTVDNISMLNDTTVIVMLRLKRNIQSYIKEDAMASIGTDGLMGDKLISIAPGTNSLQVLKNGGQIKTINPVDVDRIVSNLSKISDNAEALTGNLASVVSKINNGEGSFGKLINDDKLVKNLEGTLNSAKATVGTVQKTATSVTNNMEAAKHSFLLRGFFRKKEKKRIKDSLDRVNKGATPQRKDKN